MIAIPTQLTRAFADVDRAAIASWWAGLSDEHHAEIAKLCDRRADTCFFGVVADESELPDVERGLCDEDDVRPVDEWAPGHFEYLLNHPELVLIWDSTERTFHVGCTAHVDARTCWKRGSVPSGFRCPFDNGACLMRPLLGRRVGWRGGVDVRSKACGAPNRVKATLFCT
jgi:hypothetical protein